MRRIKELKEMRGKELDFFRIYGFRPTPQQLVKFAPVKRVTMTDKDYESVRRTVPATRSPWLRATTKER